MILFKITEKEEMTKIPLPALSSDITAIPCEKIAQSIRSLK